MLSPSNFLGRPPRRSYLVLSPLAQVFTERLLILLHLLVTGDARAERSGPGPCSGNRYSTHCTVGRGALAGCYPETAAGQSVSHYCFKPSKVTKRYSSDNVSSHTPPSSPEYFAGRRKRPCWEQSKPSVIAWRPPSHFPGNCIQISISQRAGMGKTQQTALRVVRCLSAALRGRECEVTLHHPDKPLPPQLFFHFLNRQMFPPLG